MAGVVFLNQRKQANHMDEILQELKEAKPPAKLSSPTRGYKQREREDDDKNASQHVWTFRTRFCSHLPRVLK